MGEVGIVLQKNGIFKMEGNSSYIPCPTKECEELIKIEKVKNDFWVHCKNECFEMYKINPTDIKTWFFDIERLLEHLRVKMNLSNTPYRISEDLWHMGNRGGISFYLMLKENSRAKEIENEGISLLVTLIRSNQKNSICITDFVTIQGDEITTDNDLIEIKLKKIRSEAEKNDQALGSPTYSYAGVDIYCQEDPPYDIKMVKVKSKPIRDKGVGKGDLRVLKSLVMTKGQITSKLNLAESMKEDQYEPDKSSNSVEKAVSRLRKVKGINIKTHSKQGYSLEK